MQPKHQLPQFTPTMRVFAIALILLVLIGSHPRTAYAKAMTPIDVKREKIDKELRSNLDTVLVRVSMSKSASSTSDDPHNMLLYAGSFRIEAPSINLRTGKPTSVAEQISKSELSAILDVLKEQNLFDRAVKFYSEFTVDKNFPPPKDGKPFAPEHSEDAQIEITTNDGHWHLYYTMRVSTKESASIFKQMSDVLSGRAKASLSDLAKKSG